MYMLRRFRGRLCQNLRGYRSAQPPPAAAAAALRKCTGGMERERGRVKELQPRPRIYWYDVEGLYTASAAAAAPDLYVHARATFKRASKRSGLTFIKYFLTVLVWHGFGRLMGFDSGV